MEFGCPECNRSFNELKLWGRLENSNYHWICTSCNIPLTRSKDNRKMLYGCRKCNHTISELQEWGWAKFNGDFWKCLQCNNDITKDPEQWFKDVMSNANRLWANIDSEVNN
jgi:hypothetical protein